MVMRVRLVVLAGWLALLAALALLASPPAAAQPGPKDPATSAEATSAEATSAEAAGAQAAPAPAPGQVAGLELYRLHPGDELAVRFPLNPELDTTGALGPDGRLSLPLLGRIALGGLSLDEAERAIDTALREAAIVAEARSNVSVGTYAGMVYVGGEVAKPGAVSLTHALSPLQAIIEAGGLLPTAKSRRVAVIRATPEGNAMVYPVNVRSFIRAGAGSAGHEGAMRLQPGDIVFVPRSGIAEVNRFIDQFVNRMVPNAFNIFVNIVGGGGGVTVAEPPVN